MASKIFFPPHKMKPTLGIHITLDMQNTRQRFWAAVKHTRFGGVMDLANGSEDHVPVRSAEVGWGAQACDGVLFGVGVVDHDVCCVVGFNLGGEILQ